MDKGARQQQPLGDMIVDTLRATLHVLLKVQRAWHVWGVAPAAGRIRAAATLATLAVANSALRLTFAFQETVGAPEMLRARLLWVTRPALATMALLALARSVRRSQSALAPAPSSRIANLPSGRTGVSSQTVDAIKTPLVAQTNIHLK